MSTKLGLVARVFRQNTRRFTTSEVRQISEKEIENIKGKQAEYQSRDKPVHLLRGNTYYFMCCALGLGSIIGSGHSLYKILARG